MELEAEAEAETEAAVSVIFVAEAVFFRVYSAGTECGSNEVSCVGYSLTQRGVDRPSKIWTNSRSVPGFGHVLIVWTVVRIKGLLAVYVVGGRARTV